MDDSAVEGSWDKDFRVTARSTKNNALMLWLRRAPLIGVAVSIATTALFYAIGFFGGAEPTQYPYTWNTDSQFAIVYDDTAVVGSVGCTINFEGEKPIELIVPKPTGGELHSSWQGALKVGDNPKDVQEAQIVCDGGRMFSGFGAFVVNHTRLPLLLILPFLVWYGFMVVQDRTRAGRSVNAVPKQRR